MKPVIVSHLDYRRFLNCVGGMYGVSFCILSAKGKPSSATKRFRKILIAALSEIPILSAIFSAESLVLLSILLI